MKELRVSLTEQLKSTHFRWAGYHPRFITPLANKYPFVLSAIGCVFSHRAAIDVPTSLRIERAGRKGQTATDLENEFAELRANMRSRHELAFVSVQRLCLEQEAKKGAFGEVDPREAAASRVRRAEQDLNHSQHALLMAQAELQRVPASNPPQASRVLTPGRIKSYVAEKWVTMTKRVTKISDTFIAAHMASSEETYRGASTTTDSESWHASRSACTHRA